LLYLAPAPALDSKNPANLVKKEIKSGLTPLLLRASASPREFCSCRLKLKTSASHANTYSSIAK
jgi:hypothetical protein